jgi:hypothetical protein
MTNKSKTINVKVEILDWESFCPVAFIENLENSFLIDGQPGLRANIEPRPYDSISHHSITLGEVMAAKRKRDVHQLREKEGRKPTK